MKKSSYSSIMMDKAATLVDRGDREAARALLEDILAIEPDNTAAMHRLAMIHAEAGDHRKALELYQKIVINLPDNLDAWLLLGVEHAETGSFQDAIVCFQRCIDNAPPKAGLHKMLGIALAEIGKHDEALEQFRTACSINPDDDESITRLAIELIHFLKMAEAEEHLLRALELNPSNSLAYNNLGRAYKFQGRTTEAVKAFSSALALEPDNYVVINNLLLSLNYLAEADPEHVSKEHTRLSLHVYGADKADNPANRPTSSHHPLRVGYVSGDFHNHSVAFFFEPILMHHNPLQVQAYCYSNDTREDDTTRRLMSCNVQWRNIAKVSDSDAAEMVRGDEIDILVDLSGHSSENRLGLFALKPAPVQMSWIGYPHSTGLPQMDYYLSDALCDPPGMTEHLYTERIVRLPRTFSCYLPPLQFPQITTPPSAETGMVTFGSFNNFAKVNDSVIAVWSDILHRVKNSRLFLKSMALGDLVTQKQVLGTFAEHGIGKDRIALLNTVNSPLEHLALYGQIDIALDTFPYNGTTTTCEALWMGVPVVTLAGTTHASRVGVSLLTNVGAPELIASTHADYATKAALLATDCRRLHLYRENLRTAMGHSPLMDAAGITRELEITFVNLFEATLPPLAHKKTTDEQIEEANILFRCGQLESSEHLFRELLNEFPFNSDLFNSLATVLDGQQRYREATAYYTKALALQPESFVVRFNLANTLKRMGDINGCTENLLAVVKTTPGFQQAWLNLASIYFDEGNLEDSAKCLERVISIAPEKILAWAELGDVYHRMGDAADRALSCFERVITNKPDFSSAYNSKGLILHEKGDFNGAESCFRAALALEPLDPFFMNNLGLSLLAQCKAEEAICWFNNSISLEDSPTTRFNRGMALLSIGDFERGWADYEYRFDKIDPVYLPQLMVPRWLGEDLQDKIIIVRMEQGYGDCIQCLRFLFKLCETGARIILECMDDRIKPLFTHVAAVDSVYLRGETPPEADFHIPLFSLPYIFGTTISDIPKPEGYIEPDRALYDLWRNRIESTRSGGAVKIGLVWGGRKTRLNANRSLLLEDLSPLFSLPGIRWYSLQVGEDAKQVQRHQEMLVDLGSDCITFANTGAAIANLDLVITIDTSVAHLCGALGHPAWVLLKSSADWRWMADRSDSPWYKSLTLFRQAAPGEWGEAINNIAIKLKKMTS